MSYAIIEFAGNQFKVSPDSIIVVTGDFGEPSTKVNASMLMINNGQVEVGTPALPTQCTLEVVSVQKGKKTRVATYKAKSRRRRVIGHRQFETTFKVLGWDAPAKPVKKAAPKATKAAAAPKA
jgi:ribosomal protein L21